MFMMMFMMMHSYEIIYGVSRIEDNIYLKV